MSNELLDEKLRLLVKALRADTFHFVLIINNHPSVYNDVVEWLKQHITDREIRELRLTGKHYREVSDVLQAAKQDIVTIPDFDELFTKENDDVRVALNQRRDFLAFQRMNLVCFLSPDTFRLLPKKIPDLWSLRSLELDIAYDIKEPLFTIPTTPFISSLGGTTIAEKEAEIRRLTYQLSQIDPANIALRKELEAQLVTLQMEVPQRFEEATSLHDTSQKNIIAAEVTATQDETVTNISTSILRSIFAVLPSEPITLIALQELLPNIDNLETALQNLVAENVLNYNSTTKSYKCSPVVQEVTRKQQSDHLFADIEQLISRLIDRLAYEPNTGHVTEVSYETAALYVRYGETILRNCTDVEYQLAALADRIGNYHTATGNLDKALSFHAECLRLSKELYEAYPNNVFFKNGLAISYEKLGNTHTSLGNLDKALTYYEQYYKLSKELYEAYPNNVSFKFGLAVSYSKFGNTHTSLGNLDKALSYYDNETRLFEELYEAYPNNVSFKNGLAISYSALGQFYRDHRNDSDIVKNYFQQAEKVWAELVSSSPQHAEFKQNLSWVKNQLQSLHS
uniref:TPR repeat n=1 Tax=Chlorobium chlorochromatii (strain CaD3) TaxID=340177 RepID=Q3AS87_CHLCH